VTSNQRVVAGVNGFPGATSVSRVRVYDWPTADGCHGGSPHLHTVSTEGYLVLSGTGSLQTLTAGGFSERPLTPGTLLWFTPGTVHRLVNGDGDLEILVVMQNAGLPEAGDAVLTFPTEVLADPERYALAVALDPKDRRDLAVEGYRTLRERFASGAEHGERALTELYQLAARLVRPKIARWEELWRQRALAQAELTGDQLAALAAGDGTHLSRSAVFTAPAVAAPRRYGMCGRLRQWDFDDAYPDEVFER
jgi:mannose-6-phosphate isomerase-like protein (cupin superfamily)